MSQEKELSPIGADFDEDLEEQLRSPENAAYYIMAAIDERDADYLKIALGRVAKVHGISNISKLTDLPRQTLYRMLAPGGNPSLDKFQHILAACGLAFAVVPKQRLKKLSHHKPEPSNKLNEIVGGVTIPRNKVVKKLWDYIKNNGLAEEIMSMGSRDYKKMGNLMGSIAKKIHNKKTDTSNGSRRKTRRSAG